MRDISFLYIIQSGWNIFRKNILAIILTVLVVAVPVNAIKYYLIDSKFDYSGLSEQLLEMEESLLKNESVYTENDMLVVSRKMLLYYFLTLVVSSLFIIIQCSVIKMSENSFRGIKNSFNSVFEVGFSSFPKAFLTTFLMVLAVSVGFLFCFIPGLIFLYVFFLSEYSVVLSSSWGRKALHNSSLCTRKKPLLCFLVLISLVGYDIVVALIFVLIQNLVSLSGFGDFIFSSVIIFLQQIINMFPVCCISVLYISIMDEINGISYGDGVVINDSQYQN